MIVVNDVPASSQWYQQLLGCKGVHGGDEFEMLMGDDGGLLLLLHHAGENDHAGLEAPLHGHAESGVLLYVSVSDVNGVFARARDMGVEVLAGPEYNPKAHAVEFTARDPDGYLLSVSERRGPDADGPGE